jgi:hypothetical protein
MLKLRLEPEFLDELRYFLALNLNGRNFGIKARLVVNPTPNHQLEGPKPKGGAI